MVCKLGNISAQPFVTFPPQLPGYTDAPHDFARSRAVYLEHCCGENRPKQQ